MKKPPWILGQNFTQTKSTVGVKMFCFPCLPLRARRRRSARRPRRTPSSPSHWGRCSFTSRPAKGSDGWAWTRTPPWASTKPARCGPSKPALWRGWWSTWCRRSRAKTPPTSPSSSVPTDPSPPPSRCSISCSTGTVTPDDTGWKSRFVLFPDFSDLNS